MCLAWRIEVEGALYHVMSHGNEGNDICVESKDREFFYKVLSEISQRFEIDIFAYFLMDNHLSSFDQNRAGKFVKGHAVAGRDIHPALQ